MNDEPLKAVTGTTETIRWPECEGYVLPPSSYEILILGCYPNLPPAYGNFPENPAQHLKTRNADS